jgi:hypothetical protein
METQHGMFWYLSVVTFQGDDAVEMFFIKSGECRVCFPCWQIHLLAEFLFRKVEGRNNITAVKTDRDVMICFAGYHGDSKWKESIQTTPSIIFP